MTGYSIAAIPTRYAGRQYRSRLEAKWAAFFDLLGWRHEYEPYDFGKWSPDFRLLNRRNEPALVEIKPIDEFDQSTMVRMIGAALENGFKGDLLLLGNAPNYDGAVGSGRVDRHERPLIIGWHATCDDGFRVVNPTPIVWLLNAMSPVLAPDILMHTGRPCLVSDVVFTWRGFFTDEMGDADDMHAVRLYNEHTLTLWAKACNTVQWRAPKGDEA